MASIDIIPSQQLVTATLHKEFGQDGGITLRQFGNKLVVTRVDPASEAAIIGMKRGYNVLSMNNVDCGVLSEASAQKLLQTDEMVTFLCQEIPQAPNSTVAAVMNKATQDALIGLSLKQIVEPSNSTGRQLVVSSVKPGSLAATKTDLKAGMWVKSINNIDADGLSTKQASQLMASAQGKLSILAQTPPDASGGRGAKMVNTDDHITATVTLGGADQEDFFGEAAGAKPAPTTTGLEFMNGNSRVDGSPMILIKSISPDGAFFGTSLRVGQQVLKIQNMDCTHDQTGGATAEQAAKLLADCAFHALESGSELTILAQNCGSQRWAPGALMTVVVTKANAMDRLGVVLAARAGKLFIKKIHNGTLGSTTELQEGMAVHSINNVPMASKPVAEASTLLKDAEGFVTFLVETPGPSANSALNPKQLLASTMYKASQDTKVGMGLQHHKGKGLVISKFSNGSIAESSELRIGMKVLQINNVDCKNMSTAEAAELLSNAQGCLTVVAQKAHMLPGTYCVASISMDQSGFSDWEERPKVGIKIKASGNSSFIITEIAEGGLAEATDLLVGMLLISVNNVDCASLKTIDKVMKLFKQDAGVLNILAVVPGDSPIPASEVVTGMVQTNGSVPEGSLEYDDETGSITVTDIGATGVLHGTALRSGMTILAINNVETSLFTKLGLNTLLKGESRLVFLARRQALPKNMLLTEVITKQSASDAVGIGLRIANGKIMISSIKDGSLASPTKLMPGMELVSIDNKDCIGANAGNISNLLRESVGSITIVASTKQGSLTKSGDKEVSLVTAMMEKSYQEERVGLGFVRKFDKLIITKIANDGLAQTSDLTVGMEVLSINNKDVTGMSSGDAAALLAESKGTLTILAKRPNVPPGSYVTAAITKDSPDVSIGIKLAVNGKGHIMVKDIVPQSPASFTDLEAGMLIKSINNYDTTNMAPKAVAALLTAPQSVVTILAQTTTVVAMGRASYHSMRSLTSGRSIADDTIASSISGGDQNQSLNDSRHNMSGSQHKRKSYASEVSFEMDYEAAPSTPNLTKKIVSSVPESPKAVDTIQIVQGGRRTSLQVLNVVDC